MANDRIKVPGYTKKEIFNGNIEYRNFSDDLVGFQLTSENATFTLGNFAITTSLDPRLSKNFITNKFSPFVTLCDLELGVEEAEVLLNANSEVKLKLDKSNLCNYAYFGSLLEYVRVNLEDVITKWPASLHTTPISGIISNNLTVQDFSYNAITDESTFKISTNVIENQYNLNYLQNGTIINTFNETNDLRNITVNYLSYSVLRDGIEYDVVNFTGATNLTDDYLHFTVKGDPFTDITGTTAITEYHIKPNKTKEGEFFAKLPDFQANLLNRQTVPKYTSSYKAPHRSDNGSLIFRTTKVTWPVSDGYNIDFNTTKYTTFVTDLINLGDDLDLTKTNLMVRFLTAEAISDFDTVPRCDGIDPDEETAGQKMNKTLKIYGREYDELKRYIDGIQFANTVSYDQVDNTPDAVLKYLARTLGWDLVSSVLENNVLRSYVETTESSYSGQSVGLTAVEAEVEMWRRIILNSPWIWKSKGARKSIEFLFKFIGAPDGLIEFNEFIYVAKEAIDVELFKRILIANDLEPDLDLYNLDNDGYPRVPFNNPDMYFQKGGLWYRETAGSASTIDIVTGNNPHVGPYDGGQAYINQFNCLIPDFSAVTLSSSTTTTNTNNLFSNYQSGTINDYEGDYYVDITDASGVTLTDCVVLTTTKVLDPNPTAIELTDCGCEIDNDDYALKICIDKNEFGVTGTTCPVDNTPFNIILNPIGNDGAIFSGEDGEVCSLDISFDYLFDFNCSTIVNTLLDLNNDLTIGVETQCGVLEIEKNELEGSIEVGESNLVDLYTTLENTPHVLVCTSNYCLTDLGLQSWETILGAVNYTTWFNSEGTNTSIYGCNEVNQLIELDGGSETLLVVCSVGITERQVLLDQISILENDINGLRASLIVLDGQIGILCGGANCNTVREVFENLDVCLTLDYINPMTSELTTVYEENIFDIGTGNLYEYFTNASGTTGLLISNPTDTNCNSVGAQLIEDLVIENVPNSADTVQLTQDMKELVENSFDSPWLEYSTLITDPDIISLITDNKIKISLKVKDCCVDFCVLVDRIKLNKNCSIVELTTLEVATCPTFDLLRVCDNKKSWITNEKPKHREFDLKLRDTQYDINNYKLALNSKEVDLDINPANAIEQDVFCYLQDNPCLLECSTGGTSSITFETDLDFEGILLDEAICCDESYTTACTLDSQWNIVANLGCETIYSNDNFHTSTGATDVPTEAMYIVELEKIASTLDLIFTTGATSVTFTHTIDCDEISYLDKTLSVNLGLDIEILCDSKSFQDNTNFEFQNGVDYDFN